MIKPVWNMDSKPNMQAALIEEYKGTLIYTLKAEPESLCIEINGALLRIGRMQDLPTLKRWIDEGVDYPTAIREKVLSCLEGYAKGSGPLNLQYAHAVGLQQEALEARSKREATKVLLEQEKAAKRLTEAQELEKQRLQALIEVEALFKEGEYISSDEFKGLLEKYGVWQVMPIKTKGWVNNNLVSISKGGARVKTNSKSIWGYLNKLIEVMGK